MIDMKNKTEITVEKIKEILNRKNSLWVAVDGNSASGKTTFANELSGFFDCNVFHIDDFYLPRNLQTNEIAGNIDRQRFLKEVLLPLNKGESSFFRKFDCKTQSCGEEQIIGLKKVNIVEGSYSCHPDFFEFYDMSIFLTASPAVQKERIIKRNGEDGFKVFEQKWIPAEEEYFKKMKIKEKCTLSF